MHCGNICSISNYSCGEFNYPELSFRQVQGKMYVLMNDKVDYIVIDQKDYKDRVEMKVKYIGDNRYMQNQERELILYRK